MNQDERDADEALRRQFDDWVLTGLKFLFPAVIAIAGWALTLQSKIQAIETQLEERAPRLSALERLVASLHDTLHDPTTKGEAKVEIAAIKSEHVRMDDRIIRLEERVNNLHNYMMALPVRPAPYSAPGGSRRGDIKLEDFIKGAMDKTVN